MLDESRAVEYYLPCRLLAHLENDPKLERRQMIDLSTTYLGLNLRTPLVPSASPLTQEFSNVSRLEDAGASAIVFHSVFQETAQSRPALEHYLDLLRRAKESCSVPVIASLGATILEGWTEYARQIEQAGVDALELNP